MESISKEWKLRIANDVGLDVAFFTYQEGKMSKRKLCELIGDAIACELRDVHKSSTLDEGAVEEILENLVSNIVYRSRVSPKNFPAYREDWIKSAKKAICNLSRRKEKP